MLRASVWTVSLAALFLMTSCGGGQQEDQDREYLPDEEADTMNERVEHPPDTLGQETDQRLVELREKIEEEPDNPEWRYQRAKYYFEEEQYPLANNSIEKALERDSSDLRFYELQADIFWEQTLPSSTLSVLEIAHEQFPENEDILIQLAEYKMILQNYEKAMEYIHEAVDMNEYNPEAYFVRGYIFKELDQVDRAISSFQTAVDIDPQHYEAYVELGLLTKEKKDTRRNSRFYFDNALNVNPESEDALYGRGFYYQENGEYEKARDDYKKLLEVNNDNRKAHYNLGYLYLFEIEEEGAIEKAADHFSESIRIDPGHELSYYSRGVAYKNLDEHEKAEEDFKKALELNQDFELARQELAELNN